MPLVPKPALSPAHRMPTLLLPCTPPSVQMGDKTPDARVRSFADVMREQQVRRCPGS